MLKRRMTPNRIVKPPPMRAYKPPNMSPFSNCSVASKSTAPKRGLLTRPAPPRRGRGCRPCSRIVRCGSVLLQVRGRPEDGPFGALHLHEQHVLVHVPRLHGIVLRAHRDLADDALERAHLGQEVAHLAPVLEQRVLGILDSRFLD